MWFSDPKEMLKKLPPAASANVLYSFSGSSTITSTPHIKYRKISSFTAYDFPEPEVANMVELAFSKLKRSNKIRELLWRLMPYMIPSLELKSNDTNGNIEDKGSVFMELCTCNKSVP